MVIKGDTTTMDTYDGSIHIDLVARKAGGVGIDFALEFKLPDVPRQGDCISLSRPDIERYFVVRNVWWRLWHPIEASGHASSGQFGSVIGITVECDPLSDFLYVESLETNA
jgi:hypothetical protein